MNQAISAVLFDLDGTLLDTVADIAHAMNRALEKRHLPVHEVASYRKMVGSGLAALVRRAVPVASARDEGLIGDLLLLLREEYTRHPADRTRVYEGVHEIVGELRRRGLPLAILSNKADDLVRAIVPRFFHEDDFVVVQGMRDDVPAKPDPTSALRIADSMGVSPRRVVYLGDSDIDVQTARNAGMLAVGAGWGFRGAEELLEAGADHVIMHPGELPALLDGSKEGGRNG